MPDYAIRPDDRGWPMAHEIFSDGSVAERYCGAYIGERPVLFPATINGVPILDTTIEVAWFHVAPSDGTPGLWAGGWMVVSDAPVVATLQETDRNIAIELAGRTSVGAWNGPRRIRGTTLFPFSVAEWDALTGIETLINLPSRIIPPPARKPWWHLF